MKMTAWVRSAVAMACFALAGISAQTAYGFQGRQPINLVVNGDFSANGGSLDGWTYNENVDNVYWQFTTDGTTDYAAAGCFGAPCISGDESEQNYLYQNIHTIPGLVYKLTFTYDGGTGGENELKVLAGNKTLKDLVNVSSGPNTYTVYFLATRFDTKLDFLGRQDNAFSVLTDISVTDCLF